MVIVETGEGPVVLGGDVGTSFHELGSGTTEGQRRVLALGAPTWLSHATERMIPRANGDSEQDVVSRPGDSRR